MEAEPKQCPYEKYSKINHEEIISKIDKPTMEKPYVRRPGPYKVELEADKKYKFCTCGLSKTDPFCDNSHRSKKSKCKSQNIDLQNLKLKLLEHIICVVVSRLVRRLEYFVTSLI